MAFIYRAHASVEVAVHAFIPDLQGTGGPRAIEHLRPHLLLSENDVIKNDLRVMALLARFSPDVQQAGPGYAACNINLQERRLFALHQITAQVVDMDVYNTLIHEFEVIFETFNWSARFIVHPKDANIRPLISERLYKAIVRK